MITMSLTSAIIIVILFVYRKAIKKSAQSAEIILQTASVEMTKETMILAKAHTQNVKERLLELEEEAKELGLDKVDLDAEMQKFYQEYGIRIHK